MKLSADIKILLVHDSPPQRKTIKNMLKQLGFNNIQECEHGGAGWNSLVELKKVGKKADFIISDFHMPEINGLELLQKVREDSDLKGVPFLMITAGTNRNDTMATVKAGVSDFITQPITMDKLKDKIINCFSK